MRKLRLVACNGEGQTEEDDDEDEVFYSPRASLSVPFHEYHRPRRSFHRAPLTATLSFVNHRRSVCYDRLQKSPVHFTVVKLDGSRFEIEVRKCGRVAELKRAVQKAFDQNPSNEPDKISWQHVWGHFCLCYDGHMLVDDNAFITDYGMREGDELRFVHHVSTTKRQAKKQTGKPADIQKVHVISDQHEPILEVEEAESDQLPKEAEISAITNESTPSKTNLLKKFLLHSKPLSGEKARLKDDAPTSKTSTGFVGYFKSIFHKHSKTTSTPMTPGIET